MRSSDAVQVHVLGDPHELVHVPRAPDPAHVLPVVRHGKCAFARQPLFLHVAPVVIGAPHDTAREARLERDGARTVVAAERNALQADALRIDVVARLEPVDDFAGPDFAVVNGVQAVQAQRFAGAGLIDDERGDAASREPLRQADAIEHLLGASRDR